MLVSNRSQPISWSHGDRCGAHTCSLFTCFLCIPFLQLLHNLELIGWQYDWMGFFDGMNVSCYNCKGDCNANCSRLSICFFLFVFCLMSGLPLLKPFDYRYNPYDVVFSNNLVLFAHLLLMARM